MIIENINNFKKAIIINKRLLAIDFGTKKIGIAISDSNQSLANPLITIDRKGYKKDIPKIVNILKDQNITGIVVGWPLIKDGEPGPMCKPVINFVNKILVEVNLPCLLQDERYTTFQAIQIMNEANFDPRIRNKADDKVAASIILQIVLDKLKNYS